MGVMVDLGAHCFPPATILNGGGATLELVSPFLVILGPLFEVPLNGPHMQST